MLIRLFFIATNLRPRRRFDMIEVARCLFSSQSIGVRYLTRKWIQSLAEDLDRRYVESVAHRLCNSESTTEVFFEHDRIRDCSSVSLVE